MTREASRVFVRTVLGALTALAIFALSAAADAHEPHAWDQQIQGKKRFVVLKDFDDEAVLDRETLLVWQRTAASVLFFSPDNASGASGGNEAACLLARTGGRHGWRLPSIHELNTLLVEGVLPIGHPFINIQTGFTDFYWSATARRTNGAVTLGMGFDGSGPPIVQLMDGDMARVWCVRGRGADTASY